VRRRSHPGLTTLAANVLQHACEIPLPTTTATELEPLRGQLAKAEFDAVRRHGLAAYLVAAPALLREPVANAVCNWGITLAQVGRTEDALAAYQQVITDYHDDNAPALRKAAARGCCSPESKRRWKV
jgi:hypothetical protein